MRERLDEDAPQGSDDFLYHLYRGSSLLLSDDVDSAKHELEQALALQPQDAQSQDLLAGVYFRLGLYPRAIEIWQRLVDDYPEDPTLRVNLALVLFKTGQADDAQLHVGHALRIQPDHQRAWGYLGLIHWRLGRIEAAREAFVRGGQSSMAQRMEEALEASSAGSIPAPTLDPMAEDDRAAMRGAAEEALKRLDARDGLAVELTQRSDRRRPSGAWASVEPGEERVPRRPTLGAGHPLSSIPSLSARLEEWTPRLPANTPLNVADGRLHVHSEGGVYSRLGTLRAVSGELDSRFVRRQSRGRDLDALLGGDDPIFLVHGPVRLIAGAPPGRSLFLIELTGEALYVREEHVHAFDDRLSYESANLPLGREPVVVLQLQGAGLLALALESAPCAVQVREGEEVRVDPGRLLGWCGRLFPSAQRGTAPYSVAAPRLVFRGDGVILIQ